MSRPYETWYVSSVRDMVYLVRTRRGISRPYETWYISSAPVKKCRRWVTLVKIDGVAVVVVVLMEQVLTR